MNQHKHEGKAAGQYFSMGMVKGAELRVKGRRQVLPSTCCLARCPRYCRLIVPVELADTVSGPSASPDPETAPESVTATAATQSQQFSSVQDAIYMLRKAHMRFIPSLRCSPSVVLSLSNPPHTHPSPGSTPASPVFICVSNGYDFVTCHLSFVSQCLILCSFFLF